MEDIDETVERRKLESAAASYSYLKGLYLILLGMLLILAALTNWEVGPIWLFPAGVVVVAAVSLPITRYYHENYGRVRPSTRQQARGAVAVVVGLVVMVGTAFLLRSEAAWSLDLPVNATAASLAMVMLVSNAINVGLKAHHWIIWGALLVVGLLPVWNGADPSNVGLVIAGAAMMATGVFDHRLLVRTFGSAKGLNLRNGNAGA